MYFAFKGFNNALKKKPKEPIKAFSLKGGFTFGKTLLFWSHERILEKYAEVCSLQKC